MVCPCRAVSGQQVVEGEGVYKCGAVGNLLVARPLPRSKPNQIYIPRTILPLTYFIHLPMKMEPIVSSETSAVRTQTPGNYPKRNKLQSRVC